MALKWGVAGAGKISSDFITASKVLPVNEHQFVAVASQDLERAQKFAKTFEIPKAYGDYESLAKDPDVGEIITFSVPLEVVYVGNVNPQHFEVSKLMINHGKHVLCEKPLTLNLKQTQALINLAHEKKVFLMEAVWSRCFPSYEELKKLLNSDIIGDPIHISVSFGKPLKAVERLTSKALGGGTILDLGVYTLQLIQYVYGCVEPEAVTAYGFLNEDGVDQSVSAVLKYKEGKIALLSTHSRCLLPNEACIIGTKGTIKLPRFWCPESIESPNGTINFPLPKSEANFNFSASVGLSYEAQEVRKCIRAGLLESPKITHKESLQLAKLLDKLRKDVGVVFNADL